MSIDDRKVHLVGSLPVVSAHAGFELARSTLGETLGPIVPDGETGNRRDWVVRLVERLRYHPALELERDGDWTGYDDMPSFRVRKGRRLEWIELDYLEAFRPSLDAFESARSELPSGTALQVGIPSPLDVAMIAFGFSPLRALRHIGPFRDATVRQVSVIAQSAPENVVFQLELPIEVGMLDRAPIGTERALSRLLARELAKTIRRGPTEVRYGLHLCNGDLNNEALVRPGSLEPLVRFVNAVVATWPSRRRLEFVHIPMSGGAEPAPLDPDFYQPLADLNLAPTTRLIAGFVHENDSMVGAVDRLAMIERIVERRVDLAAPCGLGRRTLDEATRNLEISRKLIESAPAPPIG